MQKKYIFLKNTKKKYFSQKLKKKFSKKYKKNKNVSREHTEKFFFAKLQNY
jgi:hypothetical protein